MRSFALAIAASVLSASFLLVSPGSGQTAYRVPRLADGHPDLTGTYDIATLTPLERAAGPNASITKEQAAQLEAAAADRRRRADAPLAADRAAPPVGGTGRGGGGGGKVGGYNGGWLDPGSAFSVVDGQIRTSIVIDPADGHIPPLTAEAQRRAQALRGQPNSDDAENADPDLDKSPGAYDDPERRPLGERCLLGFGSTSGPPSLPNYMYNNLHQIVQTKDYVMILTEMVHDVRMVRINGQHLPAYMRRWNGDSVGHWEGDTLVVDTTNFTEKTRFRGSTENLHVVERFTRTGPRTLLYRFTIEDPATWARPWTGEMTWPQTNERIYEYACHEANYALADILSGARVRDKEQAEAAKRPK